jgi:hypothetical protein
MFWVLISSVVGRRVINMCPAYHLWSIEAPAREPHIGEVHPLLAAALVTIRIYNYASVNPAELAGARDDAERIFQGTGLSLRWVNCRVPGDGGGEACLEPLRPGGEFVLRLLDGNAPVTSHVSLGSSIFDGQSGTGVLITVDPRLIHLLALQAEADAPTLLGRAIAHELGHLLIGSPNHAPYGLMRALWSQRELRSRKSSRNWRFSSDEGARMVGNLQRTRAAERGN